MDEEFTHKLVTYSDGQQVLIRTTEQMNLKVEIDDSEVVSEQPFNADAKSFKSLAKKAAKHRLELDSQTGELSVTLKPVKQSKTKKKN